MTTADEREQQLRDAAVKAYGIDRYGTVRLDAYVEFVRLRERLETLATSHCHHRRDPATPTCQLILVEGGYVCYRCHRNNEAQAALDALLTEQEA